MKIIRPYAKFVSKKPVLVLIITLLFSIFMFYNSSNLEMKGIDFEDVLPQGSEEIRTLFLISDEFTDENTILFFVNIDPTHVDSNEPQDIRDPRALRYIDILSQKAESLDYVTSVSSISNIVKQANNGYIPNSLNEIQKILSLTQGMISKDNSFTLVRINMNDITYEKAEPIVNELQDLIDQTEKPAGVSASLAGGAVENVEVNKLIGPDSQKTSMISLIGILLILLFLLKSLRRTLLTLGTILFGIVWGLGFTKLIGMDLNPITMSVTTMIMGIGIDFGIQVIRRFKYELERHEKVKAMEEALTNIFFPMAITTIAALVGFRAMALGQLKIMSQLGVIMSFGVAGCFLAAVTIIPALLVISERKKGAKPLYKRIMGL